eukprot:TRINITY_DN32011_c0_g1_i1.p1 TRINITY_DN32011_c0_g1~~TRINITY_DN32011_c0_g1_i1.p1  ORF type:complete len:142 (-),score=18.63 TRINITY_DN32011_c0_g1_i1:2-427(-)
MNTLKTLLLPLLLCLALPPTQGRAAGRLPHPVPVVGDGLAVPSWQMGLSNARDKKYDRWGYGFGSDGYLYDFVKKRSEDKRARTYNPWGFESDGFLYDLSGNRNFSRVDSIKAFNTMWCLNAHILRLIQCYTCFIMSLYVF